MEGIRVTDSFRAARFLPVAAIMAYIWAAAAQSPRVPAGTNPPIPSAPESYSAPVNLKVLPKNLTGRQVHDLMKQWSGELGVRCAACHVPESGVAISSGSYSRFADDSKPMKEAARRMYTMTEQINSGYIAKVEPTGAPVTCGTCHRGSISPQPFLASPDAQRPRENGQIE